MYRSVRLLLVVGAALVPLACFDPAVPAGASITCESDDECPQDWRCFTERNRCVLAAGGQAPRLDAPEVAPALATLGTAVRVSFGSTEPLLEDPTVELVLPDRRVTLTQGGKDGDRFVFEYEVDGSETQGARDVVVFLLGDSGAASPDELAGTVTFDFAPPRLLTAPDLSSPLAKDGDTVTIDLAFDEPLVAPPTVEASAATTYTLDVTATDDTDQAFRATLVVDSSVDEDAYVLTAVATDLAGNSSAPLALGSLGVDKAAIDVTGAFTVEPALARPGQVISVALDLAEPAAVIPTVVADDGNGSPALDFPLTSGGGGALSFSHVARTGEDGTWTLTLTGLADAAGNVTADATLGSVVIDGTPPALASFTQNATALQTDETLTVELTPDEPLASEPLVAFGGVSMTRVGTGEDPFLFEIPVAGVGLAGSFPITVQLEDVAGNVAFLSPGGASVDAVAPELVNAFFSPPAAPEGVTVLLTLTVTEQLGPNPTLTWGGTLGDPGFTYLGNTGLNYTFELDIDTSVVSGVYELVSVTVEDVAGNPATIDIATALGQSATLTVDSAPPVISNLSVGAGRYSEQPGFNIVEITFDLDEDVAANNGTLTAEVDGAPMACAAWQSGDPNLRCNLTVDGSTPEGLANVTVEAVDAAGNRALDSATVIIDKTAPTIVSSTVRLFPSIDNPLDVVTAVTSGTTVQVDFASDELLLDPPVVDTTGPETLTFVEQNEQFTIYAYDLELVGAHPGGAHEIFAHLTDLAGNTATASLGTFVVDTDAPSPLDATRLDRLVYVRRPWGSTVVGTGAQFEVSNKDEAVVEPGGFLVVWDGADVAAATRLAVAAADDAGVVPSVAFPGPDRPSVYVSSVDAAGNLDGTSATRLTRARLVATIRNEIIGDDLVNPNRLESRLRQADSFRGGDGSAERGGVAAGLCDGSSLHVVTEGQRWERRPAGFTPAADLGAATWDAVRARAVYFGGLGNACPKATGSSETCDWTWELTAFGLNEIVPLDLEGDFGPSHRMAGAMAYDARRERTVLFGGEGDFGSDCGAGHRFCGDTWEWDGLSWARKAAAQAGPSPRAYASLYYDRVRGALVLYGGEGPDCPSSVCSDVWVYDGAWTELTTNAGPGGRTRHAMVWDPVNERGLLFGGTGTGAACDVAPEAGTPLLCDDTWTLSGSSWTALSPTTTPPPRLRPAMVWDRKNDRAILVGGQSPGGNCLPSSEESCPDTWAFNGSSWTKAHSTPPAQYGQLLRFPTMVYDRTREMPVTLTSREYSAVLGFDGTDWVPVAESDRLNDGVPPEKFGGEAAYDAARGEIVIVGGLSGTPDPITWAWSNYEWRAAYVRADLDAFPLYGIAHRVVYDDVRQRVLLYGGGAPTCTGPMVFSEPSCDELWSFDGNTWTAPVISDVGGDGEPPAMWGGGFSWDSDRGVAVLYAPDASFLPSSLASAPKETWEWDGSEWNLIATTDPDGDGDPDHELDQRMVFDASRGVHVRYGTNDHEANNAIWEYDGVARSWKRVTIADPEGDGSPAPRENPMVVYDDVRQRTLLIGGRGPGGQPCGTLVYCTDAWAWDGNSFERLAFVDAEGDGDLLQLRRAPTAYDSAADRVRSYSGSPGSLSPCVGTNGCRDQWSLDKGYDASGALLFHARLGIAAVDVSALESVTAHVVAGADGSNALLASEPGVAIDLWDGGRWREQVTEPHPLSSPGIATFTVTDATLLAEAPTGPASEIGIAVRPRAGSYTGPSELAVDCVELSVSYRTD